MTKINSQRFIYENPFRRRKRKTTREAGTVLIEAGNQNRRKIS